MSTSSWVLVIVGSYFLVHALLVLFRGGSGEQGRRRETLGCGFVLIAGAVWALALGRYLADGWAGARLGFASALVLPALTVLVRPRRGRMLGAMVMLVLAVVLGVSAAPKLVDRVRVSVSQERVAALEKALGELRGRIANTEEYAKGLGDERERLAQAVRKLGHTDFDELAKDQEGYAVLKELAQTEESMARAKELLDVMRTDVEQTGAALERVKRLAKEEAATGGEADEEEIDRIVDGAREPAPESSTMTVEEHVRRERLKELFEREVQRGD